MPNEEQVEFELTDEQILMMEEIKESYEMEAMDNDEDENEESFVVTSRINEQRIVTNPQPRTLMEYI